MRKLTILYLTGCPYCHSAQRALTSLLEENEAYRAIEIEWIEENRQPEKAGQYADYWYVPTIYCGTEKLYEASPADNDDAIKSQVRAALDYALRG